MPKRVQELQVYGQSHEHQPAFIIGNDDALVALLEAIQEAIQPGNQSARVPVFSGDGEGYDLYVVSLPDGRLPFLPTDYASDLIDEAQGQGARDPRPDAWETLRELKYQVIARHNPKDEHGS